MGLSLLATLLLIGGVHAAAPSPADRAAHPLPRTVAPLRWSATAHDNGGDDDEEVDLHGQLVNPVTAFSGEWVIAVDAARQVTIVLDAATEVRKFKNRLPAPGDWLEAEGEYLPDGRYGRAKCAPMNSRPTRWWCG